MFANTHPIIDVTLPPPILIPEFYYVSIHLALLWLDHWAIRHMQPILGFIAIRTLLVLAHIAIPLTFASPSEMLSGSLVGMPWYTATYIVHFADKGLGFRESIVSVGGTLHVFQESPTEDHIRTQGLAKIARGVFKWAFMKTVIDPWLPDHFSQRLLALPYWSIESLWLTALIGIKVYLLMGLVDIGTGLLQSVMRVPMIDIFDSPILATSPRDFWSRRWNRIVHKVFHQQIFAQDKKMAGPSLAIRGLAVFLVSGLFHELTLMVLVRKMTLEQVLFFVIHGLAVLCQVKLGRRIRPTGWDRVCCIVLHFMFLTCTGRLFLASYLRPDLFVRILGL
ncbi:hypothetical protein BJV82DRAFT_587134 [Fennellomyces sp. T-0311]|nr:hypothetical protein BJV82DRAFT_587134 [Fennellomyces sp. T-0311]